jgi:AcrR family transcriptional regulator
MPPVTKPTPKRKHRVVPPPRVLRADAARNREAILAAARERFADQGTAAQMEDIARDAKVGVGTVYRHFPNKEDLIEALVERRFALVAERGAEAIGRAADEPWEAFSDYMHFSVGLQAEDRALSQVMASQPELMQKHAEGSGTWDHTIELVRIAKKAGVLRKDAEPEDVPMIICGLGLVTESQINSPKMSWRRFLAVALEGLRAPGSAKLPKRPPA